MKIKIQHKFRAYEKVERNKMIYSLSKKGVPYRTIGSLVGAKYPTRTGRTIINTKTVYEVVKRYANLDEKGVL